jgi:hypothetical protein
MPFGVSLCVSKYLDFFSISMGRRVSPCFVVVADVDSTICCRCCRCRFHHLLSLLPMSIPPFIEVHAVCASSSVPRLPSLGWTLFVPLLGVVFCSLVPRLPSLGWTLFVPLLGVAVFL